MVWYVMGGLVTLAALAAATVHAARSMAADLEGY